jgi:hypothetical protein
MWRSIPHSRAQTRPPSIRRIRSRRGRCTAPSFQCVEINLTNGNVAGGSVVFEYPGAVGRGRCQCYTARQLAFRCKFSHLGTDKDASWVVMVNLIPNRRQTVWPVNSPESLLACTVFGGRPRMGYTGCCLSAVPAAREGHRCTARFRRVTATRCIFVVFSDNRILSSYMPIRKSQARR